MLYLLGKIIYAGEGGASLNLNFSFLNWISLFLISSSYPIVLTRLGEPRSRSNSLLPEKICSAWPGLEPATSEIVIVGLKCLCRERKLRAARQVTSVKSLWRRRSEGRVGQWAVTWVSLKNELCSFSNLSVTSPTSQLILQPFRRFSYVTAYSPTLPSLYLRHSLFSNPSVASPTLQLILQPVFCFSYVAGSSLTSPGEPPMIG